MQRLIYILFSTLLITSCSSFGQTAESASNELIREARQAFARHEHARAYQLLGQIWNDENMTLKDRTEAGRYLAKMNWLHYDNLKKALRQLDALDKIDYGTSETLLLRARIMAEEEKFDEALVLCKQAIASSTSQTEKQEAKMALMSHLFSQARATIFKQGDLSQIMVQLEEIYPELSQRVEEQPDEVNLMKLYLGYSLLLHRGDEAFKAWRLFYRLNSADEVHPSLMKNPGAFQSALINYKPGASNRPLARTTIKGLAESGFYEHAALFKMHTLGAGLTDDIRINEIVTYHEFLKAVEALCTELYQETIAGKSTIYVFRERLNELAEPLWQKLSWKGRKPAYSQSRFKSLIKERFKSEMLFNTVSGYYGLHLGQIILDDRRQIEQYDQSAEFRYMVLDHMASNGFTSWFSDGDNSVGGWATNNGAFLQVRSGLNGEVIRIWSVLTDPIERKEMEDEVERLSRFEDDMARKDAHAFLPGLKLRLILGGGKQLLDSLENAGLEEHQLRYAFISQFEEMARDAKIYAHEGRHSIDLKYGFASASKDLEYTAKLSEIYFSKMPKFFLGSIIGANMGDGSSHGEANLKLVKGLVSWVNQHKAEIAGFDQSRPIFPQIDKLTDAQLKSAVRSLDPMAKEK